LDTESILPMLEVHEDYLSRALMAMHKVILQWRSI
jgi:hypothetical protein